MTMQEIAMQMLCNTDDLHGQASIHALKGNDKELKETLQRIQQTNLTI